MFEVFAQAASVDPNPISYYLERGILGITIVGLLIVIRYGWQYFTKEIKEKDLKIDALQNARLEDSKTHTLDYREMAKNDQAVLLGNAQAQELLADKIEAVKGSK